MKTIIFKATDNDFEAFRDAEAYVESLGYTVGSMESRNPIGFAISKWSNMTSAEHGMLDGIIRSEDFRNGDVEIQINSK